MYLVTGGAGFIGSNIARWLSRLGREVIICDRLGDDNVKWKNLIGTAVERFVFPHEIDAALPGLAGKIAAVIHMGAISSTTETDGDLVVTSNFELSRTLWLWCAAHDVPFIYASSAATYGGGEMGFADGNEIARTEKLRPLNLYGWSKQLFDIWALRQIGKGGPVPRQWAGLRFFNVYGPREGHKGAMMSIVCKNYALCAQGAPVKLFKSHREGIADGEQLRDFIHVDDCVSVIGWLLENPGVSGIYNVGTGQARSFRDLIGATFRACNQAENIDFVPMPETLRERYQYFTEADLSNLRAAGYDRPFLSVEDGVNRYVHDYLARPEHDR